MNKELSSFAARLRGVIANRQPAIGNRQFSELALELFALQFENNAAYRKICEARGLTPKAVAHWMHIPAVPASAFKELELSCIPPEERTAVFHSSGTTEQIPSRHFHSAESLAVYEASLWAWFGRHVVPDLKSEISNFKLIILTPPPERTPHSSLVHMFETVRQKFGGAGALASRAEFLGKLDADGSWTLDFDAAIAALNHNPQPEIRNPQLILGTAFSFVHLLDYLAEREPAGRASRRFARDGNRRLQKPLPHHAKSGIACAHH